jgi:PAS domain S-box-containing protein
MPLKQKYEMISDNSKISFESIFRKHEAIFLLVNSQTGQLIDANDAALRFYGYSYEQIKSLKIGDINKFSPNKLAAEQQRAVAEERHFFIVPHLLANGGIRTVEVHTTPIVSPEITYSFLVIRDITQRKQSEDTLLKSEARFRGLLQNIPSVAVQGYESDGTTQYWNKASELLYGYTAQEAIGRKLVDLIIPPKMRGDVKVAIKQMAETGQPIPASELSLMRKDGSRVSVYSSHVIVQIPGRATELFCIDIDLTDRKEAEEALRAAYVYNRGLIESSLDPLVTIGTDGKITDLNAATEAVTGYTRKKLIGTEFSDYFTEPEQARAGYQEVFRVGSVRDRPLELRHRDGHVTSVLYNASVYLGQKGQVVGVVVVARDITGRKLAEARLHASLLEKDILLREIHHRVKNNMQVISGLLDLQARSSGNPELIGILNESQTQIQAMSLVHEKLYGSKDFARIDMADYVRTLSRDLFESYKLRPGGINLITQTDGVYVDINKAIPCGLILNELISNALKHAFPGEGPGELQIIIRETENAEIEIVVRDNGLGLSDNVDIHKPKTVGLHLINGLVKNQLDGQMEVSRGAGTEFRIKFPL